jgi:hypothetical protein
VEYQSISKEKAMKRLWIAMLAFALLLGQSARSDEERHGDSGGRSQEGGSSHSGQPSAPQRQSHASGQRQSHGQGHNPHNAPMGHGGAGQARGFNGMGQGRNASHVNPSHGQGGQFQGARSGASFSSSAASARMHALGVSGAPARIANHSMILSTDRSHSVIPFPSRGPGGHAISGMQIGARSWNDSIVRTHMGLLGDPLRVAAIANFNLSENLSGHYYWHHDNNGFDYCHYRDNWGYHWYGWYVGDRRFWTRYYADRWWFYDNDFDRWCYWNGGAWWWQDPQGAVYLYDNETYVPSGGEQVQADVSDQPADMQEPASRTHIYRSADGSRKVKVLAGSSEAFLYDTAVPPAFRPVFLESNVRKVRFSDTSEGQPLHIKLILSDGTVEIFDANGDPMDFGDSRDDHSRRDDHNDSNGNGSSYDPGPSSTDPGEGGPSAEPSNSVPRMPNP